MKLRPGWIIVMPLGLLLLLVACGPAPLCAGQPTRAVDVSQAAAESLSQKVTAATSGTAAFRLQVTEQEVTSYIALRISDSPVSQAVVWFTPQKAYLRGQVNMAGQHKIQATLSLLVNDGALSLALLCATVDGVSLPRAALNPLQNTLNSKLSEYAAKVRWQDAQVSDGTLLLVGQKP